MTLRLNYISLSVFTALSTLTAFSGFLIYTHTVGLLGRGISPSQGRCLHTEQHKQNKRIQTSWIWILRYDRRSAGQSVLEQSTHLGLTTRSLLLIWQLRVSWFGAPSLTRRRVCRLQFQLVLASAVILGSESRRTRGHILLSQIRDFPFRRLLRLAGSRWRYSTPPPLPRVGFVPTILLFERSKTVHASDRAATVTG
jgi:hypothetical protein